MGGSEASRRSDRGSRILDNRWIDKRSEHRRHARTSLYDKVGTRI